MATSASLLSAPLGHQLKPKDKTVYPELRTSFVKPKLLGSALKSSLLLDAPPTKESIQKQDFSAGVIDLPWIRWISPNFRPAKPNLNSIVKVKEDYYSLRKRQIEAETQAWEEALREYKELERTMLEKKLAPSLPYVKTLCLSWFEQLREAIERDKREEMSKNRRKAHGYYIGTRFIEIQFHLTRQLLCYTELYNHHI
jgi:DNA-directed RNA polymerase N-terminal